MDQPTERRSDALAFLTRHHHHALVVALNLRRAGSNETYSYNRVQEDLRLFWEEGGLEHFRQEEEILLPLYARFATPEHPDIIKMLLQHVRIRSAVDFLLHDSAATVDDMHHLGELLSEHVHLEEHHVFPMTEQSIPTDLLSKMNLQQGVIEKDHSFSHAQEDRVRRLGETAP